MMNILQKYSNADMNTFVSKGEAMEKKYILEGLDCPNCALKIEKALNRREEVNIASVNAATLGCLIDYKEYNESIEQELINLIEELEEVRVIKKHTHEHHHEHHHEHSHHEHHDHEHHHDHEDCCAEHFEHVETKAAQADSVKVKWKIEGLDCANCARKVEEAVLKVNGVDTASLNFTTKSLIFYIKKDEKLEEVKNAVKKAVLDAEEVEIIEDDNKSDKKKDHKNVMVLAGLVVLVIGLIMKNNPLILISYLLVGASVIKKAFRNILRGEVFDENFLMMIATLGALFVGEYLEAVAVMLFYQVGEYFQDRAVEKSRNSIAALMDLKVDTVRIIRDGKETEVNPEEVKVNEIMILRPGERIALDGIVQKGNGSLDTSALTGEAIPRNVKEQDEVLAGCINLNGVLEVQVLKEASDSTLSRIFEMVENASSRKAKTELKMTRFAKIYTPVVVMMAVALAILPNFFNTGIGWQEWMIRACTFLVISCPCALVLSIPLGYFAGIGSASKKGILVKGGNYLEILSEVDTIVFDKTGTLTNGTFQVTEIYSENKEETIKLAALAEGYSSHPIANSILKEYANEPDKELLSEVKEIAGQGIQCLYLNKKLLVGNEKMMSENDIVFKKINSMGTLVHVAYDMEYVGTIEISDTLKKTTKKALQELKSKGIQKLVMLSGDLKDRAEAVALECGIDEVHAELLPTDKVSELEKIMVQAKGKVAFVGDGINDAPVLARSDLGIAMGGLGSEAAVEASDLVLMQDDLSALPKGIELAKFTRKIMNENITFILVVKASILLLGMLGYANMWMGVFADVGVSLIAVLNSMRILRK